MDKTDIEFSARLSEKMDQTCREEILNNIPSPASIRRWRESMGLYRSILGEIIGRSPRHIERIENGEYPVNENFLSSLREAVARIEQGLVHVPTRVRHYPRPNENHLDRYIPLRRLAETRGVWKECPWCHEDKWFIGKMKLCSRRCRNSSWRARRKSGDSPTPYTHKPPSVYITCPHCSTEFPVKGNHLRKIK